MEKFILEINIPKKDSVICDASLKFEICATPFIIKEIHKIIAKYIAEEP